MISPRARLRVLALPIKDAQPHHAATVCHPMRRRAEMGFRRDASSMERLRIVSGGKDGGVRHERMAAELHAVADH